MKKPTRLARLGRPLCYALIAAVFLPLLLSTTAPQAAADPGWWDGNWDYRAPVTISGDHPENYQLRIVLDKADNLDGHCLNNFQDVRFLENDDSGELSFWIENYIDGDNAIFWVRRGENTDNTIYVYYGNLSASWVSDKSATFLELWEDFEDVSDWTGAEQSTTHVEEGTYSGYMSSGVIEYDTKTASINFSFVGKIRWYSYRYTPTLAINGRFRLEIDTNNTFPSPTTIWNGDLIGAPKTEEEIVEIDVTAYSGIYYIRYGTWSTDSDAVSEQWFDGLLGRNYISPEPTASVGEEEESAVIGTPSNLKVESQISPQRLTTLTPEFSFLYTNDAENDMQAFQIQVGTSAGDNSMWDNITTEDAENNTTVTFIYAGNALSRGVVYWWRVKAQDNGDDWSDWSENENFRIRQFIEIDDVAVDNNLIDRDTDYSGSGAVVATRLQADICYFPPNVVNPENVRFVIYDNLDAMIDNVQAIGDYTQVDENTKRFYYTYASTDNTLGDSQLGGWDVCVEAMDNADNSNAETSYDVFTVDDVAIPINLSPDNAYMGYAYGESLTASGTIVRVSGAASVDGSWLQDEYAGDFTLGASNSYSQSYAIVASGGTENVHVRVRVIDATLDGENFNYYDVNENSRYEVRVYWESSYTLVPDGDNENAIENRNYHLTFFFEDMTQEFDMATNPENFVIQSITPKKLRLDVEDDNYWRTRVLGPLGPVDMFVDNTAKIEQYRFFLQDYTTWYIPPDGQILFKIWVGTNLAEVNSDFWDADWRNTVWLVTGTEYQIWVRAEDAPLRLVGPIYAVIPSEEKTIIVQVVISELDPIFDYVYWVAWRVSDNIIRMEYQDNLDDTTEAHVGIYDMDGGLVSEYQPDNEWFIVTCTSAEETESYEVVLTVLHGEYGSFTMTMPIGFMEGPPGVEGTGNPIDLPTGLTLAALGSLVLVFVMGLAFDALRVQLGMLAMALTVIFCWYMEFLPLPGPFDGAFTATLILVMAVLFALTWRRGR